MNLNILMKIEKFPINHFIIIKPVKDISRFIILTNDIGKTFGIKTNYIIEFNQLAKLGSIFIFMQIDTHNLINLFQFYHLSNTLKPISIFIDDPVLTESEYQHLDQPLKIVYNQIFSKEKKTISLSKLLPFKHKKTEMPVCNKIITQQEQVFRCFDCSNHSASIFCAACFQNGDHSNHRYQKFPAGGGNCDCGNYVSIKKDGFCKNHSGQAKQIDHISQQQVNSFLEIMMPLVNWYSVLVLRKLKKQINIMTLIIFKYLAELNESSIYYNVLTYRLLKKKLPQSVKSRELISQQQPIILDFLFTLQANIHEKAIKSITSVYFSMFSVEEFKEDLIRSFLHAYNTVNGFQTMEFHSLFIQLFANEKMVLKFCSDKQFTISPKKRYELRKVLDDLYFLTTIGPKAATAFLTNYFEANKVIDLPFMKYIENHLEKTNKSQMHLVDLISNHFAQQHMFYETLQQINKLLIKEGRKDLTSQILRNTYNFISSYSYEKNKAILPYHRSLSSQLFLYCQGNIQKMRSDHELKRICQVLKVTPINFLQQMQIHIQTVLICLLQFAETFVKSTYFENYLILYVLRGKVAINLDFLFVKQCLALFSPEKTNIQQQYLESVANYKSQISFSQLLLSLFNNSLISKSQLTKKELVLLWVNYMEIIMEAIISKVPSIVQNEALKINNPILNQQKKIIFQKLIKSATSVTREQMKIWQKSFVSSLKDEQLEELTSFNKATRKYSLTNDSEVSPIELEYYPSKIKLDLNLRKIHPLPQKKGPKITQFQGELLSQIFNREIFQTILQKITQNLGKMDNIEMVCDKYRKTVQKLYLIVLGNQGRIQNCFKEDIEETLEGLKKLEESINPHDSIRRDQEEKEEKQKLKELARSKRERIKKRFESKSNKILEENHQAIREEEKQEEQLKQNIEEKLCMICRLSSQENSLFYISNFHHVNFLNQKLGIQETLYFFKSCLHSAHYQCFRDLYGKKQVFQCPLCKKQNNLLLIMPTTQEGWNEESDTIVNRIEFMSSTLGRTPNVEIVSKELPKIENISVFWNILKSFSHSIGIVGLMDSENFEKKTKQVNYCLYKLIQRYWNFKIYHQDRHTIQQIVLEYIQIHQKLLKQNPQSAILFQIKICCIQSIFQSLIKPFSVTKVIERYSIKIQSSQLKQLVKNISLTINPAKQPEFPQLDIMSPTKGSIKKVQDYLSDYFIPPIQATDLFTMRRQNSKICKNGHDILICVICRKFYCYQCEKANLHTKNAHAGTNIFLSLLNGECILITDLRKIKTKSLYQNAVGVNWTQEREASGFKLNKQLYEKMMQMFWRHELQDFLKQMMIKDIEIIEENRALLSWSF